MKTKIQEKITQNIGKIKKILKDLNFEVETNLTENSIKITPTKGSSYK